MLQGLYAAASGMEAQQNQFNAISNDMANLNTPGYEATQVGFQDLLYSGGGSSTGTTVATGAGSESSIIGRSQVQGTIQQTGQPLDVAISGPGYLQVRQNDGSTALTRNGTLQVDAQGELTTSTGNPLVPAIKIPAGVSASDVTIAANGQVSAKGQVLGTIQIVNVPAPNQLQADGGSLFSVTAGSGPARPITGSTLQQGALDASNVDMNSLMAQMVDSQKTYQMASQAISYQDQMLQIANQLRK